MSRKISLRQILSNDPKYHWAHAHIYGELIFQHCHSYPFFWLVDFYWFCFVSFLRDSKFSEGFYGKLFLRSKSHYLKFILQLLWFIKKSKIIVENYLLLYYGYDCEVCVIYAIFLWSFLFQKKASYCRGEQSCQVCFKCFFFHCS